MDEDRYEPTFSAEHAARLRRWHEAAYEQLSTSGERTVSYLGLTLDVPSGVFGPTPMSDLLGSAVLDEVRPGDRVLDMGTGSGLNAILAASVSDDVVGVDVSPIAVAAARANAARNGVSDRTTFRESDVFSAVDGRFDLMIIDPPFRWFRPRDLTERAIADEGYRSLTRFMAEAPERLESGGRILVFFGTSGDFGYLSQLVERSGLRSELVAERSLDKDGMTVTYRTLRLSC